MGTIVQARCVFTMPFYFESCGVFNTTILFALEVCVMEQLSPAEFSVVYNFFSLVVATMGAAFVFFMGARSNLAPQYRVSMLVSAVVVGVAGYHYFRIFQSWDAAFALNEAGTAYIATGQPFNDAYRYADWLLTVPLLMVEAVAVLSLSKEVRGKMLAKLSFAAALMIALGYPGEIAADNSTRMIWGTLSTIPFCYILYVLWVEMSRATENESGEVKVLFRNMRLLILGTWGVYPIAFLFPVFGIASASAVVGLQVGYSIADITAKAGYGLMIYAIARSKSQSEGYAVGHSDNDSPRLAAAS